MHNLPPFQDTTKFSFLALARLAELGLAPSPQNYHLWYEIESGANPALKREADALLEQGLEALDDVRIAALFDKYFGTAERQDRLDLAEGKLSDILTNIQRMIVDATEDTEGSARAITELADKAEEGTVLADLRGLIEGLTQEARAMVDNNRALTSRLTQTSQQVDLLKSDLRRAREDALNDQLTGLSNRKAFDLAIRATIAGAPEEGPPSLLMADIDHFKSFNDRFGHTVGDEILKIVGHCLRENVKGKDTAARYGGEEFAILLPGTELAEATLLAEQLRKAVESKKLRRRATGEALPAATISIGVAEHLPGESARDWIERADALLYCAKNSGRNCVKSALPPPEELTPADAMTTAA